MNMKFDVPYEDMVRGARSGSSYGRRLSSGRGSSTASASGPSVPPLLASAFDPSAPPPLAVGSSPPTPPTFPTPMTGPSASTPPVVLAGATMVPEAEDAVSL
ncbi:hypothetical protein Taro_051312 [Colocasia esculenta]|uniref:Uncharacterized protein n=1 Tax=Colocasia esculenta TaxID=4460 RepID=A0A843XGD6_COLES|nr:hypothetical protein [Colocasia esculenta]